MIIAICGVGQAQRIVIDTASSNKYLIKPPEKTEAFEKQPQQNEDLSFGDRALSIGKGIINRLKARLNLEEAAESIKGKKDKLLKKKDNQATKNEEEDPEG